MSKTSQRLYEEIDTVTIVGGGTMGHGVAQTFATKGYDTVLNDIDEESLSTAIDKTEENLAKYGVDNSEAVLGRK